MSTVLDKIESQVTFDDQGNIPRGDNGERVPPADPAEAKTAATDPSPDPAPAPTAPDASVEKKTDTAEPVKEAAPGTITPKATPDESKLSDDEQAALKEKYSKPEDKGDEWQIRAFRAGKKLEKQLEPVSDVMERIGSPDRARRGLEMTAELADPDVAIDSAWSKVTALAESRAQELHDFLYGQTLDFYPDQVATDLVGEKATAAELKEGLKLLRSGAKGATDAPPQPATTITAELQKPEGMSDDDWADLQLDYPQVVAAMKAAQAKLAEAAAKPEAPSEKKEPELSPAEQQLKEIQEQRRTEFVNKKVEEIATAGQAMHDEIYESVVDKGLRDLGLEPDPAKDDERTVQLKTRTTKRIRDAVEPEFDGPDDESKQSDEQKLHLKLSKTVMDLLAKGDIVAARDYQDRIAAQVDLAFQRVTDAEIDLYNAAMLQSTTPKPRDGSDHKRPELVGSIASGAAVVDKTPWLAPGFMQPGESGTAAMQRYIEAHGVPGR